MPMCVPGADSLFVDTLRVVPGTGCGSQWVLAACCIGKMFHWAVCLYSIRTAQGRACPRVAYGMVWVH